MSSSSRSARELRRASAAADITSTDGPESGPAGARDVRGAVERRMRGSGSIDVNQNACEVVRRFRHVVLARDAAYKRDVA
jgi:hypothetical protein